MFCPIDTCSVSPPLLLSHIYNHTYNNSATLGRMHKTKCLILWWVFHFLTARIVITFSVIVFVCFREEGVCGDEVEMRRRGVGGCRSLRSLFSALKISEVGRSDLHLCKLNGVFMTFPVEPVDPLQEYREDKL